MNVKLNAVTNDDRPVLANLLQLYLHDLSPLRDDDLNPNGLFGYQYFDHYFRDSEPDREAHLINVDGKLAGFTMTRAINNETREVAEFFIVRRYRRHGIGRLAAQQMFILHPGKWELSFYQNNSVAAKFWPSIVADLAEAPITTTTQDPPNPPAVTRLKFTIPRSLH